MKVVLIKDAKNIGKKYDIKEVADGYALNFLLPNKIALQATPNILKTIEIEKKAHETEIKIHKDLLVKNVVDLDGVTVTMIESANEKGHLFAAVHTSEIIPFLQEQTRIQIDPQYIILEKPIKEIGEFKIPVKVGEKTSTFTLIIKRKEEAKVEHSK